MTLKLAASVTIAQTLAGVFFSFLSIKVTSIYLGPAGLGALGQLGYFMAMTQAILAAGVGTGLVKRIAELGTSSKGSALAISTVLRALIWVGVPAAIVIAVTSFWIARDLLSDERIQIPLVVFSMVLVSGLASNTILSCAYGARDFRVIAMINICSGAASLVMMLVLSPYFGLQGALFSTAILPIMTFSVAWAVSRSRAWWPAKPLSHGFSAVELRGVTAFVPLAIINSVGGPLLQLLIRDEVVAHSGMTAVGLLQGVMRMSDMYVGLAGSILSMYFFPKFCEIQKKKEFSLEIGKAIAFVAGVGVAVGIFIYTFRDFLVGAIFTKEFLPMTDLFGWQIVGNTLKLAGWPLAFALLAKANALVYAAFEVAVLVVWWLLSTYLVSRNGPIGAPQAYSFTYALYIAFAVFGVIQTRKRLSE